MDYPDKNGVSKRQSKKQVFKQMKQRPGNEDLTLEFDDDFVNIQYRYLYRLFWLLWKSSTGITLEDMYYYQQLSGIKLSGEERRILLNLSNKALEFMESKKEKPKK